MENQFHNSHTTMLTGIVHRQRSKSYLFRQLHKKREKKIFYELIRMASRKTTERKCAFSFNIRRLHGSRKFAFSLESPIRKARLHRSVRKETSPQKPQLDRCTQCIQNKKSWCLHGKVHVQARTSC